MSDSKFTVGYLYEPGAQRREDFTNQLASAKFKLDVLALLFNEATGSSTPVAQHFNGFTSLPVYNALVNIPGFSLLGGAGVGVTCTNNADDMTKVQVSTAESPSGTVTIFSQKDAYLGSYQESIGVPVYSDFVFIPKKLNWLSIDAFERANVVQINGYTEGGVGLFFAKPGKPTEVLGGLSIDWKNGKSEVAIVAGWSF